MTKKDPFQSPMQHSIPGSQLFLHIVNENPKERKKKTQKN
jgi:hypothetical protein